MMGEENPNQKDRFILKADRVKNLFPKNLPISHREDYVVKATEHYAQYRARRERKKERQNSILWVRHAASGVLLHVLTHTPT